MASFQETVDQIKKETGVEIIGLMRQTGRIRNSVGKSAQDVVGFDYIIKEKDGGCMAYYAANPPLMGMTKPEPVACPLGIVAFNSYKVNYEKAIQIYLKLSNGQPFVAISLAWPLTHPEAKEPFWHIRSVDGTDYVIGAISGQESGGGEPVALYMGPTVVKYMGPNVKYMGPQE
jgi:hypothetical protein